MAMFMPSIAIRGQSSEPVGGCFALVQFLQFTMKAFTFLNDYSQLTSVFQCHFTEMYIMVICQNLRTDVS